MGVFQVNKTEDSKMSHNFDSQKSNFNRKATDSRKKSGCGAEKSGKNKIISWKQINFNSLCSPLLIILFLYKKLVSPLLPSACRFYPTCSEYMFIALKQHGLLKGFYLGFKRVIRCNPFCEGGYDPVPEKPTKTEVNSET